MSFPTVLAWMATVSGIAAAIIVSLNLGARRTGYGFVIFTASSLFWIGAALLQGSLPLGLQNAALLVINGVGIHRYLLAGRGKAERSQESRRAQDGSSLSPSVPKAAQEPRHAAASPYEAKRPFRASTEQQERVFS